MLLQVIGKSSIVAAALVIPFLLMAAVSSIFHNHIAIKTGKVRTFFTASQVVLSIGMVRLLVMTITYLSLTGPPLKGLMSTLNEKSSVAQVIGYSLICGFGFGAVRTCIHHIYAPMN